MNAWLAFFRRDVLAAGAAAVLAAAAVAAALGPWLAPYDPLAVDLASNYQPGTWAHPLGTDHLGRDTLSRLVAGARVSLGIALAATGAGLVIGAAIGLVAAWRRGVMELVSMQLVDILLALPELLLAITAITVLGRGTVSTVVAVAIYAVPSFARIVRAAAQPVVAADYVLAARAAGASDRRVLWRHVLPGCASPMTAHATVMLGSAILLASGLSFLGLGVQPPDAEWGSMLSRGRDLLRTSPLGAVAPGVAITATVLSFSLLGDGLRDAASRRRRTRVS
jgi:ABC-type dipeptide/oligopeptide/nickel transport system permease subunit